MTWIEWLPSFPAMDRERLDNWCEKGILGLVLVILVFGPVAFGATRIQEFLVIQGLTLGVILLWLARFWLSPSYRLLWPPICWAVIAFVVYAILRYLQADVEYAARWELIRVLVYAFIFLAIVTNLSDRESSRIIVFALVIVAAVIASLAVYQFISHSSRVLSAPKPVAYGGRASGTYISPNHLAGFLEMVLPLGLAFMLAGRLGHLTKVGLGYASLAILAGIGVTLSRGGWLATGLALAAFFAILVWQRLYRLPAVVCLAVLLAVGGAFVAKNYLIKKRVERSFEQGKVDDIRLLLWRPTMRMWQDHFWWGVGPAHFDYRFRQYRPPTIQMRPVWAHNDYLNALADWGTAGALTLASAWGLLFAGVWRTWKYVRRAPNDLASGRSNRLALVLGAGTGLLAILLHSFVDFNLQIPANAIVCVTLMAVLSLQWRHATDRLWVKPGWVVRMLATTICLAALLWLGEQGRKRWREEAVLKRTAKTGLLVTEQFDLLKQAHGVEPMNYETTYRLGEILRQRSWQGQEDHASLAAEAMQWFERGMKLQPYDPYHPLRYGMCLDWLDRHEEAAAYFERARSLDPNHFFVLAHVGWHFVQVGEYATAKQWLERSLELKPGDNPIAQSYLDIVNRRLGAAKER